ncbi:hypothetical protein PUN28_011882 [Cardiocondyla obscurior]|uniref:Uncharacterized protein n=1 Tax=Cardiocondyla obscurior TaxID=286306 RepID=A0AAW2FLP2_9HYME
MYDKEKLLDILIKEEFRTITSDGKVLPPSHAIYGSISKELEKSGCHITSKHIYTILKNDRNGLYSATLKEFGINKPEIYNESKNSTYNVTDVSNSSDTETKKFKLVISAEKWAEIKPKKI